MKNNNVDKDIYNAPTVKEEVKLWSRQIFIMHVQNKIFFDTLQFSFVSFEMKKFWARPRGGILRFVRMISYVLYEW